MQLPQGMAYGWWHFSQQDLRSLAFSVRLAGNLSRYPGRYLQLYQGHIGDTGFYLGFQTDVARPGAGGQGHGLIFSRWGTRDSSNARPVADGWVENADHEGDFVGVRALLDWKAGDFFCDLRPVGTETAGTWFEFCVECKSDGKSFSAGSLRFPNWNIRSGGVSWTEVYSHAASEDSVPNTEMTVLEVTADDGRILPIRCDTTYNESFRSSNAYVCGRSLVLQSGAGVQRTHPACSYSLQA